MKKIVSLALCVLVLSMISLSCKDNSLLIEGNPTKNSEISINEAKNWYNSLSDELKLSSNSHSINKKTLLWDEASQSQLNDKISYIEIPILFEKKQIIYFVDNVENKDNIQDNGTVSKLIIYKDDKGKIDCKIANIIPSEAKVQEVFDGTILYSTPNRKFTEGWQYINNKATQKITIRSNSSKVACSFVGIETFMYVCVYAGNNEPVCSWQSQGYDIMIVCPSGSGGGSGSSDGFDWGGYLPVSGGGGGGGGLSPTKIKYIGPSPCLRKTVTNLISKITLNSPFRNTLYPFSIPNGPTLAFIQYPESELLLKTNGKEVFAAAVPNQTIGGQYYEWIIALNENRLSSASLEFVTQAILHEVGHIKLSQGGIFNPLDHSHWSENNGEMINWITDELVRMLGMNIDDARKLALTGLEDNQNTSNFLTQHNYPSLSDCKNFAEKYITKEKGVSQDCSQ